ncbi:thioesterase family protein [Robiginitomaculum antarcticum]|uniref:thioesterase family protein n=1 Tax=Robiginitomaculum antarcticum TaxID=437507 RepID=UPI0003A57E8B|nr:thioesterase family protein [Robiginitomaculum antarcticum]
MEPMPLTWVGECSAWECDELGHMNMRHYVYKFAQARARFAYTLNLPEAVEYGATSQIRPTDCHIRYLAEARPGAPLLIRSGVLALSDHGADILHIMYHVDGRPAATLRETVEHISQRTLGLFEWPQRTRDAAQGNMTTLPDFARPRGVDLNAAPQRPDAEQVKAWGQNYIGTGVFLPEEADSFGRIAQPALFGRVTSTVGHFDQAWPENYDADNYGKISGALLEARLAFGPDALPGQAYDFYSGIQAVTENVRTLVHIMVNAEDGSHIMSMCGVGGLMDLTARRHMKTGKAEIKSLSALAIEELSI